ncbi:hypothetical protein HDK64DRAFT_308968 [Phyllosticta capitalensis]
MAQSKPHNTAPFLNNGTMDHGIMCDNTVEKAFGWRPPPPVLERDGFALCDNVFTVGGYERVQGKRLAQLFNPRMQDGPPLRHHDIKFKVSATAAELRGLLESAVQQGQCDWPPMSTVLLQRQMLSDYEPLRRDWQREIAVWEVKRKQFEVEQWTKRKQHEAKQLEEQRRVREEYWNRSDANSRAMFDMKRFVREYYLSEDGKKPDRTKTPEPLILGVTGQDKFLLVHSVPGLCTAPCSNLHGFGLDICVGWDRIEVDRLAEERTKMAEEKRKREEEEEKREEEEKKREEEEKEKAKLEPHRQYMAQRASTTAPQSFEMANCIGSYIVRCDTMNEYYNGRQRLSLDVSPGVEGTLIAGHFLGIIGGTMLLGTAEDKLEELAISLDADSSDDASDAEWDDDDDATRSASKPPAPSAKQPLTKPAAQRGTSSASVLRQCPGAYFRIEEGHIDFSDDGCAVFEGRFYDNFMGKNVKFEEFKISGRPLEQPTPWKELSERNYGRY